MPLWGRSWPDSTLSSVVLPEPDSPTIARISPNQRSTSTLTSAGITPNDSVKPRAASIGSSFRGSPPRHAAAPLIGHPPSRPRDLTPHGAPDEPGHDVEPSPLAAVRNDRYPSTRTSARPDHR